MASLNLSLPSSYIIQTATEHMPNSVKTPYCKVAILEVDEGVTRASMISTRARGVRSIVSIWRRRFVGKTAKCAYRVALAEAHTELAQLLAK